MLALLPSMAATPPPPRPRWEWDNSGPMRWVRRHMGYSRGEARGMVGLLALMLAAMVAPILLRPAAPVYLPEADQQGLDKLVAELKEHRSTDNTYASRYPRRDYTRRDGIRSRYPTVAQVELAPFDPNALTAEDWEARGVPHFVAARMVKYRDAAGGFKAKAQVKKMYGLEDDVYQRLAPLCSCPRRFPPGASGPTTPPASRGPTGSFRPSRAPASFRASRATCSRLT
ncbi:ComEA family DNA-binding protein [Hymenobacter humi]|uniref:ComEA family DNA-binding protein n=1 Tax=Hymenobacter humi TaxID=1411620 RepID=A0ABW2U0Z8_9BACT